MYPVAVTWWAAKTRTRRPTVSIVEKGGRTGPILNEPERRSRRTIGSEHGSTQRFPISNPTRKELADAEDEDAGTKTAPEAISARVRSLCVHGP
jgi:hypothetical protein